MIKIKEITITDSNENTSKTKKFSDNEIMNDDADSRLYAYLIGKILDNRYAADMLQEHCLRSGLKVSVKMSSEDKEYCFDGESKDENEEILFRERNTGETPYDFFGRDSDIKDEIDASEWYSDKYGRYLTMFSDYLLKRGDLPEDYDGLFKKDTFYSYMKEFLRTKADGMGAESKGYAFVCPEQKYSELDRKLFNMRCFMYMNRFWNSIGQIRDYGYREKPVVIPVCDNDEAEAVRTKISPMNPGQTLCFIMKRYGDEV